MSPASLGALHSMLGAMDKRVSEEVRIRGIGHVDVLWKEGFECPQPPEFECFLPLWK